MQLDLKASLASGVSMHFSSSWAQAEIGHFVPLVFILPWKRCRDDDKPTGYSSITYVFGSGVKEAFREQNSAAQPERIFNCPHA